MRQFLLYVDPHLGSLYYGSCYTAIGFSMMCELNFNTRLANMWTDNANPEWRFHWSGHGSSIYFKQYSRVVGIQLSSRKIFDFHCKKIYCYVNTLSTIVYPRGKQGAINVMIETACMLQILHSSSSEMFRFAYLSNKHSLRSEVW